MHASQLGSPSTLAAVAAAFRDETAATAIQPQLIPPCASLGVASSLTTTVEPIRERELARHLQRRCTPQQVQFLGLGKTAPTRSCLTVRERLGRRRHIQAGLCLRFCHGGHGRFVVVVALLDEDAVGAELADTRVLPNIHGGSKGEDARELIIAAA